MSLGDVSKHFTEATLDSIVQKCGGSKHTSYKFGAGLKKGDSYLSKIFRLCIHGTNEQNNAALIVHTIIKAMPENIARRKLFRSTDFFRNEINFYAKVLPIWEDFQSRRKPKNPFVEYPKCLAYYCDGVNDFIVLEDISYDGYGSSQRTQCITLEDCTVTLRAIGRFHGISLALKSLEPELFASTAASVEETYYHEKTRKWYSDFLAIACNVANDAVSKTFPNTNYEQLARKFLQAPTLFSDLCQLVTTESKLSVISHGDAWSPNFLTLYDSEGKPIKTKIIDFQLARCASLANDISFFIYSCTDQELRENSYEILLKEYHKSACALIDDLGADSKQVFAWQDLLDELHQFGRFGCGMGIESLPVSLLEDNEVAELDDITEDNVLTDIWNFKPFTQPAKQQRIASIFKHAIDEKYIT